MYIIFRRLMYTVTLKCFVLTLLTGKWRITLVSKLSEKISYTNTSRVWGIKPSRIADNLGSIVSEK